jgi:hypothetical protein
MAMVLCAGCSGRQTSPPTDPFVAQLEPFPPAVSDFRGCAQRGGTWKKSCPGKSYRCFYPYEDGGKTCSDSSQCEGECIIDIAWHCDGKGNCDDPADPIPGANLLGQCQFELDDCSSLVVVKHGVVQRAQHQD